MTGHLKINKKRLLADIEALSKIGGTADGGVHRPALSDADLEARRWFRTKAEAVKLTVTQDGIGNLSAIWPSATPGARTVMFGSHLDTVPHGGRFDGALGVVAALEVLRTIQEARLSLPCHLEAISFTDEEGTATGNGLVGSRGLAGLLDEEDLQHPRHEEQAGFEARLAATGITIPGALAARRKPQTLKAWIEVHVEQGPRLDDLGIPIGVVTGIAGIYTYWLTFRGRADHSGTIPLDQRRDALQGAALFVRRSRELVGNYFEGGVMNCGMIDVSPGAFNIVPEVAHLAIEVRHANSEKLGLMCEAILNLAQEVAREEGLELEVAPLDDHQPAQMHPEIIAAIEDACELLDLPYKRMSSYAGHDTQIVATITRAGMFFVPSVGGISHSPHELTHAEDCINAGNLLLHTVLKLTESG